MTSEPKPVVYITRSIPESALSLIKRRCTVLQWDSVYDPVPREKLLGGVSGVNGIYCLLTDTIDKRVLDEAGLNLKVVSTMSVGYNHIDIQECNRRNIPVGFTPGLHADATAELAIALLLMTSRRLVEAAYLVKSGRQCAWTPLDMCGATLSGSTVGILGLGSIGIAVAQKLKSFGPTRIIYSSRTQKRKEALRLGAELVSFERLLEESDSLIVCCALTEETRHLIDMSALKRMKTTAVLVNISRGDVVNQGDLYNALIEGDIAAAGLDVTTPEPLPMDHPLLDLPNCVVLPHVGSAIRETRTAMAVLAAKNLLAGLNNEPLLTQVP